MLLAWITKLLSFEVFVQFHTKVFGNVTIVNGVELANDRSYVFLLLVLFDWYPIKITGEACFCGAEIVDKTL